MEDTARNRETVLAIAELLEEHKGVDTIVLDISKTSSWADYLIISTVHSSAHAAGLMKFLYGFFKDNGIEPINVHKNVEISDWLLVDCGDFVINLMEKGKRNFYELEKLWFKGKVIYQSSKSS
ncbi:MAG: ribosome silencing factor [Spirochaetales bacterium]|nr:ribosome silencing factor [Spirochaetales bacterium]